MGIPSFSQKCCTRSSPLPIRLTMTPKGRSSSLTMSTASVRSCMPKGVGSVTRSTMSVSRTTAITGHDVPGGASRMASAAAGSSAFTARMSGGASATPTSSLPVTSVIWPAREVSTTPMRRSFSVIALGGHTSVQPPQPWHISGKTRGVVPKVTIAENWQIFEHSPQPSQSVSSTTGTGMPTTFSAGPDVFKNRCALGSSTSQSASSTSLPNTRARLTLTVVFPVPPFPEATDILMPLPPSLPKSAGK